MDSDTDHERAASVPVSTAQPDPAAAVKFLEDIAGGLPVAVAEVPPEGGGVRGATFDLPDQRQALMASIQEREGRANLYYSLSAPAPDRARVGKAGKLAEADVSHIRGVALDLDPGDGPLEKERAKLWERVNEAESAGGVFGAGPSYVIDSGGGAQVLWLFADALPAETETAAAVKAQARGMANRFGLDAVQSLDHLFRTPFTRNLPNAKKRARGRVGATACVEWSSAERHPSASSKR